jgi:hypothetical protein
MSARLLPDGSIYRPTAQASVSLVSVTPSSSSNVPLSGLAVILHPDPAISGVARLSASAWEEVPGGPIQKARRAVRASKEVMPPDPTVGRKPIINHSFAPTIRLNGPMSSVLTEIVIESADPHAAATFWSAALEWELREYMPGNVPWMSASGDPERHDLKLVFVKTREGRPPANRLYVNPSGCDLSDEVERLRELGATPAHATVGAQSPGVPWVAMIDPGGTGLTVLPNRID